MSLEILLLITQVAFGIGSPLPDDEEKRVYNFGLGKRGYTYVSEYKRLPVYNFGLGKRADPRNTYSFGLGKRDDDGEGESPSDETDAEKRSEAYDFGPGKRLTPAYNFGLGKKAVPQYSFGLGKRLAYDFGLGKRRGTYSFGVGEKDKQYSFGLGKRYGYLTDDDEDDADSEYGDVDDEKRGKKFSFASGRRQPDNFSESGDDNDLERQMPSPRSYGFGLGERSLELPLRSISSQPQTKGARPQTKPTS